MLRKLRPAKTAPLMVWKVELRIGPHRVHRHIEATTQEAHRIYAELRDQAARAKVGLPVTLEGIGGKPLRAAADDYLQYIQDSGHAPGTRVNVARALVDACQLWGEQKPVGGITRDDCERWRNWRLSTPKRRRNQGAKAPGAGTVNSERGALSGFLSWCVDKGWLRSNPMHRVPQVKAPAPPLRTLSWADFNRLADEAWRTRPAFALLLEVLAETGARISEATGAKTADVDTARRTWTRIQKGGSRVNAPAGPWVLEAARLGKEWLCPDAKGHRWPYPTVRKALADTCKAAGVKLISPHVIRHARATWDVEAGLHARAVQERLGHASILTTQRYFESAEAAKHLAATSVPARPVVCRPCDKAPVSGTKRLRQIAPDSVATMAPKPKRQKR